VSQYPETWVPTALMNVADVRSGIGFPHEHQGKRSGDLPFYKVGDISRAVLNSRGVLNNGDHYVSREVGKILKGKPIAVGSTVFAKIGEAIRLNRRAITTSECLVDNNVMAVTANDGILDRYLFHFMRTTDFNEASRATTVPSLRKGDIEELVFPLAPSNEQKRIADKLDVVLARVDACRERLDRVPAILKRFRQSVLAAATSGKLSEEWRNSNAPPSTGEELLAIVRNRHAAHADKEQTERMKKKEPDAATFRSQNDVGELPLLPSTWVWAMGAEIVKAGADIVYGIVQPGPKLAKGVPYVRGMDIENGRILVDQLLRTSGDIAQRYSRSSLESGDVLLGIIRATKVAIVPPELSGANITQGTARYRPSEVIQTKYLAQVLESPLIQDWLHAHYRGIDMPGLNLADVRRVPIPLPPIEEQGEIVRRVSALLSCADRIEARYITARAQVERLTPALLAKAFRGELVSQDPNDEPARVLLDRIRESKETVGIEPKLEASANSRNVASTKRKVVRKGK